MNAMTQYKHVDAVCRGPGNLRRETTIIDALVFYEEGVCSEPDAILNTSTPLRVVEYRRLIALPMLSAPWQQPRVPASVNAITIQHEHTVVTTFLKYWSIDCSILKKEKKKKKKYLFKFGSFLRICSCYRFSGSTELCLVPSLQLCFN